MSPQMKELKAMGINPREFEAILTDEDVILTDEITDEIIEEGEDE